MESLIETFHLDVKLVIAQLVNFVIVLLVLWFFALKPLLKTMNERSAKIEKSLRDAQEIEERVKSSKKEREEKIAEIKRESLEILAQTQVQAEENRKETINKTKEDVAKLVNQGKEQLAAEKDKMVSAAKTEVADLVVAVTKKVLGSALTKDIDKKVIEDAIEKIK
ncbi:MAG: F0F1 ATP synthase subunit B [Patescibacteria group bacterium]|jgi:F-type H+-transporting ATPase subunit b